MAQLYFNYAAMNAGKSLDLLKSAENYTERGMGVLLLKPSIDTRDNGIKSRVGLSREANIVTPDMNLFEFYKWAATQRDIHCVFVDEAQFLTHKQVTELCNVVDKYSCPVLCYGLRTDFQGNLFEGSKALLGLADKLEELKAVCHCGRKATMTARIREDGSPITSGCQVEIGGNDTYTSLCRKHWNELTGIL